MALPATMKVLGLVLGILDQWLGLVWFECLGDVISSSVRHIGVLDQWLGLVLGIIGTLIVVFVVVCFVVAFIKLIEGKIEAQGGARFWIENGNFGFTSSYPIMTNAYVCHFNVQPIYNELEGDVLTNFDRNLGIRFSTALNYICSSFGSGFPCYSLSSTINCG
ncbi:amino acid transporter AVT6E-like [Gossypium arboreum]|uniref:amino acid transporter AVT6E-like n=1 Tax=Gossypium arboreum TaxID=29729 RepID=UPI0022F1488C|nr:amino acid transporter AVT6E-like [Gossypium arboreum]